jgi:ABC-type nitrate/sulfonate/bicarbonate transport system permease component
MAFIVLVAAELIAAKAGLGFLIQDAGSMSRPIASWSGWPPSALSASS